jgi:proteasome lid subunit RPN8/RPN11
MNIQWTEVENSGPATSHADLVRLIENNYACSPNCLTPRLDAQPNILVVVEAWVRILNHLEFHRTEQGGLLLGYAARSQERSGGHTLLVAQSVPAQALSSSSVSLTIAPETWTHAQREISRLPSSEHAQVIGWYHSHPNLGAFFSETDRHTQRSFFRQDYSLGIVIDPIRSEVKAYLGPKSTEVPIPIPQSSVLHPLYTKKRKRIDYGDHVDMKG